jgi:hypothetical protein
MFRFSYEPSSEMCLFFIERGIYSIKIRNRKVGLYRIDYNFDT